MSTSIRTTTLTCVFFISFASSAAAAPPNFVIFLADDMGYSDVGCYGGEIATPNLDALATRGVRYTQFYNTARCWPTRAALLTGYYAQQVGFDGMPDFKNSNPRRRPAWAQLLPEYLRTLGYRNYHSGKWHLDSTPFSSGFDHSYTLLDYDRNFGPQRHTLDDRSLPTPKPEEKYYSTTAIADHTIDFLKEHDEKHREQPFFAYVAFTVPHFPLQAPPDDIGRVGDRYEVGWDVIRRERWKRIAEKLHLPGELSALEPKTGTPYFSASAYKRFGDSEVWLETPWEKLSAEKQAWQAQKMAIHAAMVERMDREIGRVLDQVRAMNAEQNTLVLFLSDNGASAEIAHRGNGHDANAAPGSARSFLSLGPGWSNAANTPFRRHKIWVNEGGIATPLIASWPAGISAKGELRHTVGHVIDITPTLVKLSGGEMRSQLDGDDLPPVPGRDLAATFNSDVSIDRDCLWWLHERNRAIRKGDWKLVEARDEKRWRLFDLSKDRAENHDLVAKHPDKVRELSEIWESKLEEFRTQAQKDAGSKPSPAKRARTKRLQQSSSKPQSSSQRG
jgi:arylsulfatase